MRGNAVGAATLTSLRQEPSRPERPATKRIIYYTDCFGREWAIATSAATANVAAGTLTAATPTITGTVKADDTVTAHDGNWGPSGVTLKYQWYASGQAINGATGRTMKLSGQWAGKTITVTVTGYTTPLNLILNRSAGSAEESHSKRSSMTSRVRSPATFPLCSLPCGHSHA
jgi:hypothetical protein